MSIIENMSDAELIASYSQVSMYDYEHDVDRDVSADRTVTMGPGFIMFDYDIRCQASSSSTEAGAKKDIIWGSIKIVSNIGNKTYAESKAYKDGEEYFEKYTPIMLRISDDPNAPCLPFEIDDHVGTIGALFYTRERR